MLVLVVFGKILLCSGNNKIKKGNMKKVPIILTTGLLVSGLNCSVMALENRDVTSAIPNQVIEPALEFRMTNPTGNMIDFKFDGRDRDLRMRKFLIASYDFPRFSQRMVEERLTELGTMKEPSWTRRIRDLTPDLKPSKEVQEGPVQIDTYSQFFGNNPGLFYYAAQIQKGSEEPYWIRGKIDYRLCSYYSNHSIHNTKTCYGRIDEETQKYVFERREGVIRDEDDEFVTWEDEWAQLLMQQVNGVRSDVRSWNGSLVQKEELLKSLQEMWDASEDANNQEEVLAKIKAYKKMLEVKTAKFAVEAVIGTVEIDVAGWEDDQAKRAEILQNIAQMKTDLASVVSGREELQTLGEMDSYFEKNTNIDNLLARVEYCETSFKTKTDEYDETHKTTEIVDPEDKGEKPEQPGVTESGGQGSTGSGNQKPTGSSGGSDSLGQGSGLGEVVKDEPQDGTEANEGEDLADNEVFEAPGVSGVEEDTVKGIVNNIVAKSDASEEVTGAGNAEKTTEEAKNMAKNDQRSVSAANIPVLSEVDEVQKSEKWYILPAVGLVLAVGAAIWRAKKAFWGRKA